MAPAITKNFVLISYMDPKVFSIVSLIQRAGLLTDKFKAANVISHTFVNKHHTGSFIKWTYKFKYTKCSPGSHIILYMYVCLYVYCIFTFFKALR